MAEMQLNTVHQNTDHNLCYRCEHRKDTPGSAHSSCSNPRNTVQSNIETMILLIKGSTRSSPNGVEVTANPHGIQKGWFVYPLNFDPVWLESCDGFSEKV